MWFQLVVGGETTLGRATGCYSSWARTIVGERCVWSVHLGVAANNLGLRLNSNHHACVSSPSAPPPLGQSHDGLHLLYSFCTAYAYGYYGVVVIA
jgi:hypothetical protein